VKQEAICALLCIVSSIPDMPSGAATTRAPDAASPGAVLIAMVVDVRAALQKARFHPIRHVRDVTVETVALLNSVLPEKRAPRRAKPVLQPTRSQSASRAAGSRKGPWLHQKQALDRASDGASAVSSGEERRGRLPRDRVADGLACEKSTTRCCAPTCLSLAVAFFVFSCCY
jgi:hypothetical protein